MLFKVSETLFNLSKKIILVTVIVKKKNSLLSLMREEILKIPIENRSLND